MAEEFTAKEQKSRNDSKDLDGVLVHLTDTPVVLRAVVVANQRQDPLGYAVGGVDADEGNLHRDAEACHRKLAVPG